MEREFARGQGDRPPIIHTQRRIGDIDDMIFRDEDPKTHSER